MIILIDAEKTSDKIKHQFMIKIPSEWVHGTYLDIMGPWNDKSTANILSNGENLKAIQLRLGTRQ